ncbi:hypothetical protein [Marilutibacter chinensis]|uniref:Uncharacterized protein n=1 Tax=Marilutibacter chinensis TaxID=2912247 RepID=A0ABS9HZL2_9GAMM|nr:hypothetical protein [Lysobacter chinensis]MCF7223818.1 hypothetical protein [Lysobacter chinensis]
MSPEITAGLFGILGVLIGGLVTWWLQKDRSSTDFRIALEAIKTEHMAETAAKHFLSHQGYTDRSFELISKRLGGFEENELRRVLVRAGAIRYIRKDGTEFWRLLSREPEAIAKARAKSESIESSDDDL